MPSPLISFVIPCYNYGRYLKECLDGVFNQEGDYNDFEIIAIDDASQDNTLEILRSYEDPRLRVIVHEKNQGHVVAMNRGLQEASGKYLVRIDPDDRHRPNFLKETVPILEKHPEVGLVFSDVALIDEKGVIGQEKCGSFFEEGDRKGNELVRVLSQNYICAPTVLARRSAWMEAFPVPSHLAFNDWYFSVMLARHHEFYFVDQVLADYRVHSQNHHSKIILDKSEEKSILWLLNKVYQETEANPDLEKAKRKARRHVYGSQYLDFANKYFGAKMNADARRCYFKAIFYKPKLLFKAHVIRHFGAVLVGRNFYEFLKKQIVSLH